MANRKTGQPINGLTNQALLPGVEAWCSTMTEFQTGMLEFMSHRFAKDADAVREISSCRNRAEASALHWKWAEESLRDYSTEAMKMVAIYTKNAAGLAQNVRPRP